jgi:hypothetical protein
LGEEEFGSEPTRHPNYMPIIRQECNKIPMDDDAIEDYKRKERKERKRPAKDR